MSYLRFRFAALLVGLLVCVPGLARAIDVQTLTSPDGISFWLYEDHGTPITSIEFAFQGAGAAADGESQQGLANLVSGLLDEGAGPYNSLAFQKQLDDLGASIGYSAGRDSFSGSFTSLSATLGQSINLLHLSLTAPHFDREAVDRIKRQIAAGIARSEQNPNAIAANAWRAAAYPGHGYGRPVAGTVETLSSLGQTDLKRFMRERLTKTDLVIAVVGDITGDEAGRIIDRVFGGFPENETPSAFDDEAITIAASGTVVIDYPSPQTVLQFGLPGLLRDDPDFLAGYVMNHILGGGSFSSRMMQEIREKRGLTYGVGTGLAPYRQAGILSGGLATKNESAGEALDLVREIITLMAAKGVTDKELADAKNYLIGAYPLRFDSNAKIASQLLGLQLAGFAPSYFAERNDLIAAISQTDVARVAKRLLRDDLLFVVAVGQPVGIDATDNPED